MKKLRILIVALVVLSIATAFAISSLQDAPEVIKKAAFAIQTGNASELSKFFNKTVELELLGEENFYSKSQAELLLKDFFEKNKPVKFVINHQGVKETSSFAIGTLTTKDQTLRVSFFMKSEDKKSLIHQFRIEKNEEGE